MKKFLPVLIKITVSSVLLYVLFTMVDIVKFWTTVKSVEPLWLAAAALFFIAAQGVSAYRWSVILKKDVSVPYRSLLSMYVIGMFFNNFMPTIIGGDVVKGYYFWKKTGNGALAFASILMDRYLGFTALMTITLLALIPGYALIKAIGAGELIAVFVLVIGGFVAGSFFIWFEPLNRRLVGFLKRVHLFKLNEKIHNFYLVFMGYKSRRGDIVKAFSLSIIIQLCVILGHLSVGSSIGIGVPPVYFFLFVPLTVAAAMMPVSISGLGLREGAFVFLFTKAGATGEQALGLSLIWFLVVTVVSVLGALEYARSGGKMAIKDKSEILNPEA